MQVEEFHADAEPTVLFLHGGNVAGWMWADQVEALPDHHCLVPDLPGFGRSGDLHWTSLADVADQLAALIAERAPGGSAHVVGLSLGAVLGSVLTARHPDVVHSALLTGAALRGVHGLQRLLGLAQLRALDRRWYWTMQARLFGLPADVTDTFVADGLALRRENYDVLVRQVYDGDALADLPGLRGGSVPILALAGERESRDFHLALEEFTLHSDLVAARLVPRLHHVWSVEDPELFNAVLRQWLIEGTAHSRLLTYQK